MSNFKQERFGRYLILDHLVDGGMAKICRARYLGEQADKIVAIKMVQSQFSKDEAFKTMFIDEIKVTFGLLHPNIVQTYDYGLHNDQLYVAMEYCDGRNLKEYLERLTEKKYVFPVEISVYIISQVCQGLHYAHTYTDKLSGKQANIIHRDISPHNIMLTYDGAIKIIDFGIAKAESNTEATQVGTIKGKLSYLAPEYLDSMELDHRYDQFAVGITLWEMLCSRKLFKSQSHMAILKKIQECNIPAPSSINPNVPKELDEIVLKALSKDRTKRFEDMDKFNRALIKFLYANFPDFNSSDLSYFAKELFKDEIKKDREKLFEFGKIDITNYLDEMKKEKIEGVKSEESITFITGKRKSSHELDFGFDSELINDGQAAAKDSMKKSREKTLKNINHNDSNTELGANHLPINLSNRITKKRNRKSSATDEMERPVRDNVSSKVNEKSQEKINNNQLNGKQSKYRKVEKVSEIKTKDEQESSSRLIFMVACLVFSIYIGREHIPYLQDMITKRKVASINNVTPNEMEVKKDKTHHVDRSGISFKNEDEKVTSILFKNFDKHAQIIYIDGKRVQPGLLSQIELPRNKKYILRIEKSGFKHIIKQIETENKDELVFSLPDVPPENFGYLKFDRDCKMKGNLYFNLYGENRVEKLPFQNRIGVPFPVKGDGRTPAAKDGTVKYTLYFEKPDEKIKRKFEIKFSKAGDRVNICDAFNSYGLN